MARRTKRADLSSGAPERKGRPGGKGQIAEPAKPAPVKTESVGAVRSGHQATQEQQREAAKRAQAQRDAWLAAINTKSNR